MTDTTMSREDEIAAITAIAKEDEANTSISTTNNLMVITTDGGYGKDLMVQKLWAQGWHPIAIWGRFNMCWFVHVRLYKHLQPNNQ